MAVSLFVMKLFIKQHQGRSHGKLYQQEYLSMRNLFSCLNDEIFIMLGEYKQLQTYHYYVLSSLGRESPCGYGIKYQVDANFSSIFDVRICYVLMQITTIVSKSIFLATLNKVSRANTDKISVEKCVNIRMVAFIVVVMELGFRLNIYFHT